MSETNSMQRARVLRILGVDTALRTTGYGLVDTDGHRFKAVDCGVVKNHRKDPHSECLRRLSGGIIELIETYAPDVAAIEGTFYFKNARTAMILGMARGSVVSALTNRDIPIYEYAPRRVKQAVCGSGAATKAQVALLVGKMLNIQDKKLPDDATDALGLAICHSHTCFSKNGLMLPDQM